MKRLMFICAFLTTFLLSFVCFASTYYLSPGGSNTANGVSESTPWKSFAKAFGVIAAGDELVLLDGTYSEAVGTGYISWNDGTAPNSGQPPSGTSLSSMTVVRAKNPGSVVINGGSRAGLFLGRSFRKDSYIKIQDIKFEGGGDLYNTSYITIKECGFHSERLSAGGVFGIGTNDHANGNSYNLIEDCWVWGKERIIASNYRANNNIWRRVVIRGDGCSTMTGSGNPNVGFTVYDSSNNSIQNMIVIDRILDGGSPYADFATAQHTDGSYYLGPNEWLGCISLKAPDSSYYFEADYSNNNTVKMHNCISWGATDTGFNVSSLTFKNVDLQNLTFGYSAFDGFRVRGTQSGILRNIISTHSSRYGVNTEYVIPAYTDVFGSGSASYYGNNCSAGGKVTDPQNDGTSQSLKFLVRIEDGSTLKGTGANGADYGANIIKRYGVDGSRYGEVGYNTITDLSLWPWPNEDRIKTDFSASSIRGFCADGRTLTKYIWEYLGNTIPAEIYGSVPTPTPTPTPTPEPTPTPTPTDTVPPSNIIDLAVTNVTKNSITLKWTSPGDDGNTGIASSYDIRYSNTLISESNFYSATRVSNPPTPASAGTIKSFVITKLRQGTVYYFAIKTKDEVGNTSEISNVVNAKTLTKRK